MLEDLADLFRVLMADNRTLTPIGQGGAASRASTSRSSRCASATGCGFAGTSTPAPDDALVPPLLLQPLVENAVYHGIEPGEGGGEIAIDIRRADNQVVMTLTNPYSGTNGHPGGNKMAIANIRERLQLHYDVEASMRSEVIDGQYRVTIRIPYIAAGA